MVLPTLPDGSRARSFGVICAGEALWNFGADGSRFAVPTPTFRPGGGAVNVALALARQGLHVGLVTVLADDTVGRALREEIAAAKVDAGGVELSKPSSGLFLVE